MSPKQTRRTERLYRPGDIVATTAFTACRCLTDLGRVWDRPTDCYHFRGFCYHYARAAAVQASVTRLSAAALFVGFNHLAYTSAVMLMDECPS